MKQNKQRVQASLVIKNLKSYCQCLEFEIDLHPNVKYLRDLIPILYLGGKKGY